MKLVLAIVCWTLSLAMNLRPGSQDRPDRYSEDPRIVNSDGVFPSDKAKKRAEAAATLFAEREDPSVQFYPVASLLDEETYPGWQAFQVMLQSGARFRLLKVCLPNEDTAAPVVLEQTGSCASEVSDRQIEARSVDDDVGRLVQRAAGTATDLAAQLQRLSQSFRPPKPRPLTWAD